jgi:hypothetical protein
MTVRLLEFWTRSSVRWADSLPSTPPGAIDPAAEKRLVRKLDRAIIPLLGISYLFYVSPSGA